MHADTKCYLFTKDDSILTWADCSKGLRKIIKERPDFFLTIFRFHVKFGCVGWLIKNSLFITKNRHMKAFYDGVRSIHQAKHKATNHDWLLLDSYKAISVH